MNDWLKLSGLSESVVPDLNLKDFAKKRGKGANKIAQEAKAKGGPSILTYHHFDVKLPYYEKASKGTLDFNKSKEEYKKLISQLSKIENIDEIDFQKIVGKIEVLGELIIEKGKK
jgi:hypothetical protein